MLICFSHVQLFATPGTVACQAPLSVRFFRQEYQSGLPFPTSRDLPNPGIEPTSLLSPALSSRFLITVPPGDPSISSTLDLRPGSFCQSLSSHFCCCCGSHSSCLFVYFFIYGWARSSLLHADFLSLQYKAFSLQWLLLFQHTGCRACETQWL